jgi:D-sedoheptulose 7-phosphate isomerase
MGTATGNNKTSYGIADSLRESSHVLAKLAESPATIKKMARVLVEAYKKGGKMVLFGNGGSAADAQHLATELLGGFTIHKRASLPALALTTDTSALTAIGNDFSFDDVFSRQVEAMVNAGDVVIAISTSGNSENVLRGAKAAKARKATVIGFTGETGGKLKAECDICFCVPSTNTPRIQEAHITTGHILCAIVEQVLAKNIELE